MNHIYNKFDNKASSSRIVKKDSFQSEITIASTSAGCDKELEERSSNSDSSDSDFSDDDMVCLLCGLLEYPCSSDESSSSEDENGRDSTHPDTVTSSSPINNLGEILDPINPQTEQRIQGLY